MSYCTFETMLAVVTIFSQDKRSDVATIFHYRISPLNSNCCSVGTCRQYPGFRVGARQIRITASVSERRIAVRERPWRRPWRHSPPAEVDTLLCCTLRRGNASWSLWSRVHDVWNMVASISLQIYILHRNGLLVVLLAYASD